MNTEELGQHLNAHRLERNIALPDISAQTRINVRFLEAVERGEFSLLPQSYIRSFLWSYASTIGMLPSEALTLYDSTKTESAAPPAAPTEPIALPKRSFFALARPIFVGAVVLAAVGVAILVLRNTTQTDWPG